MGPPTFVAVVGHGSELEREDGAAAVLRTLGAEVRTLDLWGNPSELFHEEDETARVVLLEALDRPDLARDALRALHRDLRLADVGTLLAVTWEQAARIEPSLGFDDFVLVPYVPAELYARIRSIEWRRSEFTTGERVKMGSIVIDYASREVTRNGVAVVLSTLEFSLLAYLTQHRGRVVSRDELLHQVWKNGYNRGARSVDICVCNLRAKLGTGVPLTTVRGAGYRIDP